MPTRLRTLPGRSTVRPPALSIVGLLIATAGCDVVQRQERAYQDKFASAGLEESRVELDEGRVRYWSSPSGSPLLMLHGFGGHALWQWHQQVGPLTRAGVRVIAPDLVGFGETHSSSDRYSVPAQADLALELMEGLGVQRYDVLGLSYGGYVALELARRRPNVVQRLILVDCPGPAYSQTDYEVLLATYDVDSAAALLIPQTPNDIRRLLELIFSKPPRVPRFALRQLHESLFTARVSEQTRLLESLVDTYRVNAPEYPTQTTLVLWGEDDRLFPLSIAERLVSAIGTRAELDTIAAAGHAPNLERPVAFNESLIGFLTSSGQPD